ncbi:hypothetical protein J6590_052200 [Homalodisca vitripennis]|nr:hypothetical protein J6590_052200 [Homalodisca vitripennis]
MGVRWYYKAGVPMIIIQEPKKTVAQHRLQLQGPLSSQIGKFMNQLFSVFTSPQAYPSPLESTWRGGLTVNKQDVLRAVKGIWSQSQPVGQGLRSDSRSRRN